MTLTFAIVILFAEVWLFAHGRPILGVLLAVLVLPGVLLGVRRERRGRRGSASGPEQGSR